ncbi:Uncharacterized protein SHERM_03723 [Striga hermonthica]|uniref:Zinc-ribbon domain-containing protein n=1 Tax=Striga hermonthica TaxID=68872 RepID=A0A9N7RLP2_STRHE|nr:Uncharacterized protein SHERM_03723 [Striga hermonthica]
MSSQVSTKVRLVRCPKCRQVLAELPEVPLYKCGGCGTVLLAKNRKQETTGTALSSQETESSAKSRPDELVEANSSSKPFASQPKIESLSDKDSASCNNENSVELREEPERVLQKGDDFVANVQSISQKEDHLQEIKPSQIVISSSNESISPPAPAEQNKEKKTNSNSYYHHSNNNAPSRCLSKESLVSFYLTSSDNEHPDHFPRENRRNFGRFNSSDTFGSSSPKNGSYYTYYGSESSYDGNYDRVREKTLQQQPRKNKDIINNRSKEWGPTRNHNWSQPVETGLYSSGVRSGLDRREDFSRLPLLSRPSSGPLPASCSGPDKLDLLRTVCELQDQIKQMQFPEIRRYSHTNRTYGQLGLHYRPPQPSCSCPNCLPRPYSAQLPPHRPVAHPSISSFSSQLPSVAGHEPTFDNGLIRARLKEKYFARKRRHILRPVAGGAPLVACYRCFELLRLPEDFFLFHRKKYRQLACGACGKVLRFSLGSCGTRHMVPYVVPGVSAPCQPGDAKVGPSSEIEEELSKSPLHRLMGYASPSQVLEN